MEVVPLLHLKDGGLVVGRPGDWQPFEPPYPDGGHDLRGFIRHLFVRFRHVALVDLGSGRTEDPDHTLYQKLAKQQVLPWVDAFPESLEDVLDLFVSGAERVTVRMDRFDVDELTEVLEMADGEIWLGYPFETHDDLRGLLRDVDPHPLIESGAKGIVLIDLGRAGSTEGVDPAVMAALPDENVRVHVAGGIGRTEDADALKAAGASGVLVGTALLGDVNTWASYAKGERDLVDEARARAESEAADSSNVDASRASFTVEHKAEDGA